MRFNPNADDSRPTIEDYLEATGNQEEYDSYKMSTYAWNPNEDETKKLRVTKSSQGTFSWCPEQYYLEKFKGLRGEQQPHHVRGLNVHDMMEWFWANFSEEMEEHVLTLLAEAHAEYNDVAYSQARDVFFNSIPQPPEPYEYGEDEQIAQWLEWQFHRLQVTGGKDWRPVGVEANIHATRTVVVDGEPIPIHMNGFIDTLFADDDGFALMELKTGKYKKRSKVGAMRKEMGFYRMMLEHSKHQEFLPITHWGWEFPGGGMADGEGATIYYEHVSKGSRVSKSVENALEKLVRAHINMEFPPEPFLGRLREGETMEEALERNGLKCSWCDYREHCSQWAVTDDFLDEIMEEEK